MSSKFQEKIEDAMRFLIEQETNEQFICANWILISEWADYGGTRYLHTEVSEAMTPWNAYGMIQCAQEYNNETFSTEETEEDED
jgi:hypothetical protein